MLDTHPCYKCSKCVIVQPIGFASKEYMYCKDLSRRVHHDDGCTMGDEDGPHTGIEGLCNVSLPADHNRIGW